MVRMIAIASLAAALATLTGCPGIGGCGIGPVPYANSDGGTVSFNSIPVGSSNTAGMGPSPVELEGTGESTNRNP